MDIGRVRLRRSGRHDAEAMARLARGAYEPYIARIGRPPAPMSADYSAIAGDDDVWIAESDGAVIGMLVLVVHDDHLLLDNVAVSPTAQGHGVGGPLLRFAEQRAVALGLPEIRLYTNEAMTENIEFYLRHGYVETRRGTQEGFRRVFLTRPVP